MDIEQTRAVTGSATGGGSTALLDETMVVSRTETVTSADAAGGFVVTHTMDAVTGEVADGAGSSPARDGSSRCSRTRRCTADFATAELTGADFAGYTPSGTVTGSGTIEGSVSVPFSERVHSRTTYDVAYTAGGATAHFTYDLWEGILTAPA